MILRAGGRSENLSGGGKVNISQNIFWIQLTPKRVMKFTYKAFIRIYSRIVYEMVDVHILKNEGLTTSLCRIVFSMS